MESRPLGDPRQVSALVKALSGGEAAADRVGLRRDLVARGPRCRRRRGGGHSGPHTTPQGRGVRRTITVLVPDMRNTASPMPI
jgi:hypothetical protein